MEQDPYARGAAARQQFAPMPSAATSANMTPVMPGTPNTDHGRNPFGDGGVGTGGGGSSALGTNPFTSPDASRPASSFDSTSLLGPLVGDGRRFFHSRRVAKGDGEKPWLNKSEPKEKWVTIFPLIGIAIGLAISGFLVWDGMNSVVKHKYCPVMDEQFGGPLNTNIWTKEVEVGGFGYVLTFSVSLCLSLFLLLF